MTKGVKYDEGKLRWSLLPWESIEQVLRIIEFGAQKYSPGGWKTLDKFEERYYNACMRHLIAWQQGEKTDPESGLPHLAHAGCNILFLLWKEQNDVDSDI